MLCLCPTFFPPPDIWVWFVGECEIRRNPCVELLQAFFFFFFLNRNIANFESWHKNCPYAFREGKNRHSWYPFPVFLLGIFNNFRSLMRTWPFTAPLHALSHQALNKPLQTLSKIKSCEYGKWQGFTSLWILCTPHSLKGRMMILWPFLPRI